MMDAASPMLDVVSLLTSSPGDHTETPVPGTGFATLTSAAASSYSTMSGADSAFGLDMAAGEEENWIRVPANWLDAMPAELYEREERDQDAITACNSDDNGLYRMFRNLSP